MIEYSHIYGDRNKNKRQHGLLSNLVYNLKENKQCDPKLFYYQFLCILPFVIASYLGTVLPSEVVRGLEEQWAIPRLIGYILLLSLVMWACNLCHKYMDGYLYRNSENMEPYYSRKCFRKMMSLDYDLLELPVIQKLVGNTWSAIRGSYTFVRAACAVPDILGQGIGVLLYGVLIARKSPVLLLCLMANVGISLWLLSVARKKHREKHGELSRYAKEAAYISRQAMETAAGKDIRIYQMADWILEKYDEALEQMNKIFAGIHSWYFLRSIADCLVSFLVEGFAWGYLLYMLAKGELTVAEFVLYLGLINGFTKFFEQFIRRVLDLTPTSVSISYLREFLEIENHWGKNDNAVAGEQKTTVTAEQMTEFLSRGVKLELKDVSYIYPGEEEPTISHINLTIQPGEKLALLGLNGAGKTTLVKLICGFYQPTEGTILVNDIPVKEFAREDYYRLISVLFQDVNLLPVSLDKNITGQEETGIDRERLEWALKLSGFLEKYDKLPEWGDTLLVREVHETAVDFSGGEKQKLLFARALYKNAPLLILDEPTAALDPIAESELYENYGEATEGKTSIYISHRLSSTRFCDRIILLEHGKIVEEGTHDSLMAGKTRYAELFELQSKYYKEQEEQKRRKGMMGDAYSEDESGKEGVFHE